MRDHPRVRGELEHSYPVPQDGTTPVFVVGADSAHRPRRWYRHLAGGDLRGHRVGEPG